MKKKRRRTKPMLLTSHSLRRTKPMSLTSHSHSHGRTSFNVNMIPTKKSLYSSFQRHLQGHLSATQLHLNHQSKYIPSSTCMYVCMYVCMYSRYMFIFVELSIKHHFSVCTLYRYTFYNLIFARTKPLLWYTSCEIFCCCNHL